MICKYCNADKPETNFEIANIIKGVKYRRRKCQRCYQDTKNLYRKKVAKWIEDFRKTKICVKCSESDFRCLDFHHIKDKKFTIADICGKSIKSVKEELEKCIVLCSNCHRKEHYDNRKTKK